MSHVRGTVLSYYLIAAVGVKKTFSGFKLPAANFIMSFLIAEVGPLYVFQPDGSFFVVANRPYLLYGFLT